MAKRTLPPLSCLQKATPTKVLEQEGGGSYSEGAWQQQEGPNSFFFSCKVPASQEEKNFLLNSTRLKYTFGSKQVEFPFQDRPILSRPFGFMVGIVQ